MWKIVLFWFLTGVGTGQGSTHVQVEVLPEQFGSYLECTTAGYAFYNATHGKNLPLRELKWECAEIPKAEKP